MIMIWNAITRVWRSLSPPAMPSVDKLTLLHKDQMRHLKVCAVTVCTKGILFTPYHNVSRNDAWIKLIRRDGTIETILKSNAETYGTPDKVGDWWIFPHEEINARIKKVHDRTCEVATSHIQPAQYATRCLASVIGVNGRNDKPFLWDAVRNRRIHTFDAEGIISGIARIGGDWVAAIMDGGKPGLYSTRGWRIAGRFPEVVNFGGELIAFEKSGAVEAYGVDGRLKRRIGTTGTKPQRARLRGGLVFFTTANWDGIWVTDGKRLKLLHEWRDGDRQANDGSLFNTSIAFDGKDIIFARSIDSNGIEIWRVTLK